MSKLLRSSSFLYLGKISYSLYMWHTMIMFPLKKNHPENRLIFTKFFICIYYLFCFMHCVIYHCFSFILSIHRNQTGKLL